MKTYKQQSVFGYGEGDVYVLETLEDWDEYEKKLGIPEEFLKRNPNFYSFKEDFKKYIGKIWVDKEHPKFIINNEPICARYKVIAMEDNNPQMDWYWQVQNVDDERDIKFLLVSDVEFENHLEK